MEKYKLKSEKIINEENSLEWLQKGRINFDGEKVIVAAHDQVLVTNRFKKMPCISNDTRCRFSQEAVENVNHIISRCKLLFVDGYYTKKHIGICRYVYWIIRKKNLD